MDYTKAHDAVTANVEELERAQASVEALTDASGDGEDDGLAVAVGQLSEYVGALVKSQVRTTQVLHEILETLSNVEDDVEDVRSEMD